MINPFSSISYPGFKLAIVLLLAVNAMIYARMGHLIDALDECVWLIWLMLYELETDGATFMAENNLHKIRSLLIAMIAGLFILYVHDSKWLDVINAVLWFALIALLELEARWTDQVLKHRQSYWLATAAVFAGLIAVPIVLALQSAWLDVYDATLWLAAFAFIEMDIVQLLQRKHA